MLPNFDYVSPGSVQDAVKQLSSGGARVLGGGSDLLRCFRDEVFSADKVVSLRKISALKGIKAVSGGVSIGAMTTIADVAKDSVIRVQYPGLAKAASEVASPQLRNQGTIGGNICQRPWCWYFRGGFDCLRKGGSMCYAQNGDNRYHAIFNKDALCFIVHPSDTAPALMALQAMVSIAGPKGTKKVRIDDFFVGPGTDLTKETILEQGQVVTEIFLPAPAAGLRSSYLKIRERKGWDLALVSVALALQMKDGKVAGGHVVLGGVAPVPFHSKEAESAIMGKALDAGTIEQAAADAVRGAEPMKHNGYKVAMLRGALEEALQAIAA
ncbi:MAG: xanthine dehydrogenase family protein subunit M [Thermodesulfobacteriota bacterium]